MKELWSKKCKAIKPYIAGEQPRDRAFLKLNTNENPYPPSPKALAAIREAVGSALRLYPDLACTALRGAIGETLGVEPAQVYVGNGSDEVLSVAFRAFFDEDRPIRFPDVTYSFYPVFCDLYGIPYETVPLAQDFTVPAGPFLERSGGVVLANPNAPTGLAMDRADLEGVIAAHPARVVIVDEAYVEFGGWSAVELLDRYPNLLVVRTLSKSGALAGLRVGYALGHPDLIEGLCRVRDCINSYPVDALAQAGAEAAIRDGAYYRALTEKIKATRDRTARTLRDMGFRVPESSANFLFLTHPTVPAKALLAGLRERGILVRWWDKPRIDTYLRITVGTEEDMETLCRALEELTHPANFL